MTIGFVKQSNSNISPVVPGNIAKLKALFEEVFIEPGIGVGAFFEDEDFEGVQVKKRQDIISSADVIVQITPDFTEEEYKSSKEGAIFIGQYAPLY